MALGSMPEQFTNNLELDLDKYGYIIVDEKNRTSKAKIFAGGDIAGCKGTVAWAARSGKDAANSIDEYLKIYKNKGLEYSSPFQKIGISFCVEN